MARGLFRHPPRPQPLVARVVTSGSNSFVGTTAESATAADAATRALVLVRAAAETSYRDAVLADNPVAYWRLGETSGSTAVPVVGPAGAYVNGPTLGAAGALLEADKAATFLQSSLQRVDVPDDASIDLGNGPLSYEAWVNNVATGYSGYVVSKGAGAPALVFGGSGDLRFFSGGSPAAVSSVLLSPDSAWHHVVGTKDASNNWKVYVDGADATTTLGTPTSASNASGLTIACPADDLVTSGNYFNGSIDEVALYATVLTPTRVAAHYAAASARRLSDATAQAKTLSRTTTESRAQADAATRALVLARSTTESSAQADAAVRALSLSRSTTDAGAQADAATRGVSLFRSVADAMAQSDVVTGVARSVAVWTTPLDGVPMSSTPELKFTMPTSASPMFFDLQLDTAATFDTGSFVEAQSNISQAGWDYWNGSAWTSVPATGVPIIYSGNEARYTVQSPLATTTWYRRVRAGAAA